MTFRLLKSEVSAVGGGFRDVRTLDGDFAGWLRPYVDATGQEAKDCPERSPSSSARQAPRCPNFEARVS